MSAPRREDKHRPPIAYDSMPGAMTEAQFRDYMNSTLRGMFENKADTKETRENVKRVVEKMVHERLPAGVEASDIRVVDAGAGMIEVNLTVRGGGDGGVDFIIPDINLKPEPEPPNTFLSDLKSL